MGSPNSLCQRDLVWSSDHQLNIIQEFELCCEGGRDESLQSSLSCYKAKCDLTVRGLDTEGCIKWGFLGQKTGQKPSCNVCVFCFTSSLTPGSFPCCLFSLQCVVLTNRIMESRECTHLHVRTQVHACI